MPAAPPTPAGLIAVMGGGVADWSSGTSQTIYTAQPNINGMPIVSVYGRSPTGIQPLTIQLMIGGVAWGVSITLLSFIAKGLFVLPMPSGFSPMLGPGDAVAVVPSLPASGKMTFDVVGYNF